MTQHRLSEAGGTRRLIPSLRGSGAAEPPRAHLARRPSPGSRGPARPPAGARPAVTAAPRNGDHRAQEQPLSPPGPAACTGDRPAGCGGPGAAGTRTRPGQRSSPSGRSERPLCPPRLLLAAGYSPRHCHGGASTRARRLPLGKLISPPLLPFANLPKEPAKSQKRLGNERRRLKS